MINTSSITRVAGRYDQAQGHYTLVAARFNSFVVDSLIQGALDCLHRHGIDDSNLRVIHVPGAFEIPLTVKQVAAQQQDAAIIALGAVIRGGTPHFDYVSSAVTSGLANLTQTLSIPVINGVLTVNSIEQAIERSGTKAGNKGEEAAQAALEMVSLLKQL